MRKYLSLTLAFGLLLAPGMVRGQEDQPLEEIPLFLQPSDTLTHTPTVSAPKSEDVRKELFTWLEQQKTDSALMLVIEPMWPADAKFSPTQTLDKVAQVAAVLDPRVQKMVELCNRKKQHVVLAKQEWMDDDKLPDLLKNNLRVFYGRWLARELYYDETLECLAGLKPEEVVDPATLLFYEGVAHHRLLHKALGLAVVKRLLTDVAEIPQRYESVASLMEHDLNMLEDESLDMIARQMGDIERRLGLGRPGKMTIKVEEDVIAALDK